MKKIICLSFAVFFVNAATFAQSPKISFEHLNMRNGLAAEYIGGILQDEKGYIWLNNGTTIARYNGYSFKNYELKVKGFEGTFNTFAYGLFNDKNKTLWVGTLGGDIFRYDPVLDSLVLEKTGVNKAAEGLFAAVFFTDRENQLWHITYKTDKDFYFERYDPRLKKAKKYGRTMKNDQFFAAEQLKSFFISRDGDLLVGARNGFYHYDFKQKRFIGYLTAKDSLSWLTIGGTYRESSGSPEVWLLGNKIKDKKPVLYRYNMETNLLKACVSLPDDFSKSNQPIFTDKKGQLWVLTSTGLFLYDKKSNQKTDYLFPTADKDAKSQDVRGILVDRENEFWIATDAGLLNFDPATGQFQRYKANQSDPYALGHIHVTTVFEDRTGLKWVGMDEYGVDRISNLHTAFTAIKNNPEQPGSYPENVTGIALKADGNYWLTSQLGLFEWDVKKNLFTQVVPPTKKKNEYCASPRVLPNGALCFAGQYTVNIYGPAGKMQSIPIPGKEFISNLYKDAKSNIWVLTFKGKFYKVNIEKGSMERYSYTTLSGAATGIDTSAQVSSYAIGEDAAGNFWLCTSKMGMGKVDQAKKQIIVSPDMQGKVLKDVNKLYDDRAGNMWIGTNGNGLWLFDLKSKKLLRQVKDDQGVLANDIRDIAEDKSGNLWIVSQRGMAKFNYKSGIVLDYTVANNIPLEVPVKLLTLPDGRFVLCMFNSVLTFDPEGIKTNAVAPQVQVESVVYSNPSDKEKNEHTINALFGSSTTIPYNQNRITFNYAALHFVNPAQNKYSYMLEGYATTWTQAQLQRTVTYNNLAPGTYTFRVKAANSDGVWNNKGAFYTIIIETPWWSRWWAWVLYVVVFGSAIIGFINYRSRQLIRRNKKLEERIAVRTHQLSEANEELQSKQEEITSQRDQLVEIVDELKTTQTQLIQSEKMASLGELTAGIAHEIQNPLNFVNNFSEVSIELLDEMEADLNNDKKEEAIEIATDIRQNLQKITHHGKRADGIVKSMLQHSRNTNAERQLTNLNVLADEYLRLAFHGLRAKNKDFNADIVTHFDNNLPEINVLAQDIGRVLINLYNNAFYSVQRRHEGSTANYKPAIEVSTVLMDHTIQVKVKDNGVGIPDGIKQKIMQPFFTTKPTGEGTGLGLSLSYDIVVKGHGGTIDIDSKEGEGAEFTISLPLG